MGLYRYSALDSDNVIAEGTLEADSPEQVAGKLKNKGLRPLQVKLDQQGKKSPLFTNISFQSNKITRADIDFFTQQVSLLLNAGLSLDGALRVMKNHSQKPAFKEFTGSMERKLKEGKSFSQALADYPHFSPMYVNIARAGEEGGILPAMLMRIKEYQSTFQELKQFVVSAAIYPLFLLVVGIIALLLLVTTILPRFELLFEGIGRDLPPHVALMMNVSGFIRDHFILTTFMTAAPIAGLIWYLRTAEGTKFYQRLSLKVPIVSGFVQALETTRIFRTLEVLVNNGVHLVTALRISSGIAVNYLYQNALTSATEALKEGQRVSDRLKAGEQLLPALAVDLLAIGEDSGRVGEVCGQVADHFDQELRTRIKRVIALIEPLFILIIALVAGYVVVSMLSVILSINDIAG